MQGEIMFNPQRFNVDEEGYLAQHHEGNLVNYSDFVDVMALAIDCQANHEFLKAQVPDLKKALVDILVLAAQSKDPQAAAIKELASKALSQ
jgi:hypothetical protein